MRISKIAKILEVEFVGKDIIVNSFANLEEGTSKQIAYIDHEKYLEKLKITNVGAVIVPKKFLEFVPKTSTALIDENPHLAMARISKYFAKDPFVNDGIGRDISLTASIDKSATICDYVKISKGVRIMAGAIIGAHVSIGKNSIIYPNAVIYDNSQIGENCIIHAGVCIGSDGYGYAPTSEGEHIKIYHFGTVILGNNVEIGANSAIDRGVFGATIIEDGTKIDNLVHIAHNCQIGQRCIMVAQSGLAGSTKLGRNVTMGGQSGCAGHLEVGDFATIAARGGVTKSIQGGQIYAGFPLMLHKDWLKSQVKMTRFFKN
ncbi:MAG: UDP-3-O-(3-hydroxymyristoyl)glucosamine N-acyltransferase [Sulfurospirillum sp.]|nr:UDP-3-O-(3-hydroxymyristoyl)glucosamine N-acyltransferase [Sulfurospirillum sp.]